MHRRFLLLLLLVLAACAPQAGPNPATSAPASASDTPAALTNEPPAASPTNTVSPTAPPTSTFTATVTEVAAVPTTPVAVVTTAAPGPDITPQPGLIVRGYVRLADGTGVADVRICRSYASYPGTVVATTDANGYFESEFAFIPGDEMVTVWPLSPGYGFRPENYYWRHYYGSEDRSLEFIATLTTATAVPTVPCQ